MVVPVVAFVFVSATVGPLGVVLFVAIVVVAPVVAFAAAEVVVVVTAAVVVAYAYVAVLCLGNFCSFGSL